MQATFKIPVKNMNPAFIKEMQEKYSDAELVITVNRKTNFNPLDENIFWEIIDLLDWEKKEDKDIIEPAVSKLTSLTIAQIYNETFEDPAKMPKDITFEPILYLASKAYERKTGQEFIYIPLFDYETYSNEEGWKCAENIEREYIDNHESKHGHKPRGNLK